MNRKEILKYIAEKQNYIENDYKLKFIFEIFYLPENDELYKKKLYNLERKLDETVIGSSSEKMKNFLSKSFKNAHKENHTKGVKLIHSASLLSGFSKSDIAFIDDAYSDESKEERYDDFITAFEKIVSDVDAIPSNSLIILSQEPHHMERIKRKLDIAFTSSAKKRKLAAGSKGQKTITDYFKSTKSPNSTSEKKSKNELNYKLEEIILNKRGSDAIKILWIPKGQYELDPINYMSVIFCEQVVKLMEDEDYEAIDACKNVLNILPNDLWQKIMAHIEKYEEMYEIIFDNKRRNDESTQET